MGRGLSEHQRRVLAVARKHGSGYVTTAQARAELYGWWWARRASVRQPWQVYSYPKPSQTHDLSPYAPFPPPEEWTTAEIDATGGWSGVSTN